MTITTTEYQSMFSILDDIKQLPEEVQAEAESFFRTLIEIRLLPERSNG